MSGNGFTAAWSGFPRWLLVAMFAAAVLPGVAVPRVAAGAAAAPQAGFGLDPDAALARSRAVLGTQPGDFVLRGADGRERALSAFRGKPLLVNFLYTGCHRICPNSTLALRSAIDGMRDRFPSDQFHVVSIGFDLPNDSPEAMRDYARTRRIDVSNWEFLSPREADVTALSDAFGFSFAPTAAGFDHTLQVSVVDAGGRIYRQVLGDAFTADALGEPLRQLAAGQLLTDTTSWSSLVGRIRILCSVYDPLTGNYRRDWTLYLEIAGGLTFLLAMVAFAWSEWRGRRRDDLAARATHPGSA